MTVSLTVNLGDFCQGIHPKATLSVGLDQICVLRPPLSPEPGKILDPTAKTFALIGGTITIELDSSNDLLPVAPNIERPRYRINLAAPGWGGCYWSGYITADTSLYTLLTLGSPLPNPLPIFDLGIANFGIVGVDLELELSDGTLYEVPLADLVAAGSDSGIYIAAPPSLTYNSATNSIDIDFISRPAVGNLVHLITPANLDRSIDDIGLKITVTGAIPPVLTHPLQNFDGVDLSARYLTPDRLYQFVQTANAERLRLSEVLQDRPQDYMFVVAQDVGDVLTTSIIANANHSDTNWVGINQFAADTQEYVWLGVPEDSWDITAVIDIVARVQGPPPPPVTPVRVAYTALPGTMDWMGIPYKWWISNFPRRRLRSYFYVFSIAQTPPPL